MMGYEQWLELRRANPGDKEILRVGKLKTIQTAEANAQHLRTWLADRVNLHLIASLDDAHRAADVLSRSANGNTRCSIL